MASDSELLGRLGIEASGAETADVHVADLRRRILAALDPSTGPEGTARSLFLGISSEFNDVQPNAEYARVRIDELLSAALVSAEGPEAVAALHARADALHAEVTSAAAIKEVALEAELVAADGALERALESADALRAAASGLSDSALAASAPALLSRLEALCAAAAALPTGAIAEATLLVVPAPPAEAGAPQMPPRPAPLLLASLVTAHVTLDDVRVLGAAWDGCTCAAGAALVVAQVPALERAGGSKPRRRLTPAPSPSPRRWFWSAPRPLPLQTPTPARSCGRWRGACRRSSTGMTPAAAAAARGRLRCHRSAPLSCGRTRRAASP